MKNKPLFFLCLFIAVGSWLLLNHQIKKENREALGEMKRVVVAEVDIEEGTFLTRDHIKPGEVPSKYLSAHTILAEDVEAILGHPVTRAIPVNQQLSWDDLNKYVLKLSSEIPQEFRAFTLDVDPTSTQGGQLRPGDTVDVLLLLSGEDLSSCRTILQNVVVLSVGGRRLSHEISSHFATVTLQLTPEQCQHLALARETGRLILTLRSSQDQELIQTAPTLANDLGKVTYQMKAPR